MITRLIYASLIAFLMLQATSCGNNSFDIPTLEEFFTKNNIEPQETSSGLFFEIFDEGAGEAVDFSKFIVFNFTQFDLTNSVLSSTANSDFPAALQLSLVSIPGLVEGLSLLRRGGRANIYIPIALAGNNTLPLIYNVEIVEVYDSLEDYNDGEIEKYLNANQLTATRTADGMYVIIEEPGGEEKPDLNSTVTVDYHGYFLNGDVFDSSVDRGEPATFALTNVIQGWQLGIPLFGEGGKGTVFVPSILAYGTRGNNTIPPNYPIAFDVELVEIAN